MMERLLILHADDLGMTHSVNAAAIRAFESGALTSGSIMVPCPWFPEIACYARRNSNVDIGVHLTLTSERTFYRWGPILSKDKVPTLLDGEAYFHKTATDALARLDPDQAEAEMRAQIERAIVFGIRPTHLDSHQWIHYMSRPLFERLLLLGREFSLPILITRRLVNNIVTGDFSSICSPQEIMLDSVVSLGAQTQPSDWEAHYASAISAIPFGTSQIIFHPGFDDSEMRAATCDKETWGAAWRQRDFDYLVGGVLADLLRANHIKLTTWGEIGRAGTSKCSLA